MNDFKDLHEVMKEYLEIAKQNPVGGFAIYDHEGKILAHSKQEFVHCYTNPEDLEWAKAHGYKWKEEIIDGNLFTWVTAKETNEALYQSKDGGYYREADLPEHDPEFVTELYSHVVRAERDARIADTDNFIKLEDITVKKDADKPREALSEDERAEVLAYRTALRDFPQVENFPYVVYPTIPACIAYECEKKIKAREQKWDYQ